jgi:hypothetical protein
MEQRSFGPQADPEGADALRRDEPLLAELYSTSISGRVATGPRAGKRIVRVGDGPDAEKAVMKPGHCCASVEGFSVHAGVCAPSRDRIRLAPSSLRSVNSRRGKQVPGYTVPTIPRTLPMRTFYKRFNTIGTIGACHHLFAKIPLICRHSLFQQA